MLKNSRSVAFYHHILMLKNGRKTAIFIHDARRVSLPFDLHDRPSVRRPDHLYPEGSARRAARHRQRLHQIRRAAAKPPCPDQPAPGILRRRSSAISLMGRAAAGMVHRRPHAARRASPITSGCSRRRSLHGATHQAVMEFQVVTDKRIPKHPRRPFDHLLFLPQGHGDGSPRPSSDHQDRHGRMKISSPELTALDLLRYAHAAGTIDSIATVLSDLGEKIRPDRLTKLARAFERTSFSASAICSIISNIANAAYMLQAIWKQSQPLPWVELDPGRSAAGRAKDRRAQFALARHRPPPGRRSTNDPRHEHHRVGSDRSVGRSATGRARPHHQPRA